MLHDIADYKYHGGDISAGPKAAEQWMTTQQIDAEIVEKVVRIIKELSFKGAGVKTPMSTPEGKAVQDADRLDAMGAIGIARTFAYGGYKGHALYDPAIKPVMHNDFESYRKSKAPVINHFYEKLLLLKERMNTETGRRLAEKRHAFMETYLETFFEEWYFPENPENQDD